MGACSWLGRVSGCLFAWMGKVMDKAQMHSRMVRHQTER